MENLEKQKIKELMIKYNKPDKNAIGIVLGILIFISIALGIFEIINKTKSFVTLILFIAFIVIDVVLIIYYLYRLFRVQKFEKKMDLDNKVLELKGKPTKVIFQQRAQTRSNYYYKLSYLILTFDNNNYLYVLPEQIELKRFKYKKVLKEKILNMNLELKYWNNSKIICLEDSTLYQNLVEIVNECSKKKSK